MGIGNIYSAFTEFQFAVALGTSNSVNTNQLNTFGPWSEPLTSEQGSTIESAAPIVRLAAELSNFGYNTTT
jgi:hypothetical protein